MELGMSKRYSYIFRPMSTKFSKFYEDIQAITILEIGQVLPVLWHFEILTWEKT